MTEHVWTSKRGSKVWFEGTDLHVQSHGTDQTVALEHSQLFVGLFRLSSQEGKESILGDMLLPSMPDLWSPSSRKSKVQLIEKEK